MDDLSCHYVSRFATKAFEIADRRLWVYDFERKTFRLRSSRTVFARRGTNSRQTERRLDQLIETPISNAMTDGRLLSPTVDWKLRRAIVLSLTLQGARAGNALGPSPIDLGRLLHLSDGEIDQVVMHEVEQKDVAIIELPDSERFFYPQVGFFAFPLVDPGCISHFGFGFALPVSPRRALATFPKTADPEFIKAQIAMKNIFMGLSLGTAQHCNLVVIPPEVKQANSESALVEAMTGLRRVAQKMITDVQTGRERVAGAALKLGIDTSGPTEPR